MPDAYPRRPDIAPVFFETFTAENKNTTLQSIYLSIYLHCIYCLKGIKLTLLSCIVYCMPILYCMMMTQIILIAIY